MDESKIAVKGKAKKVAIRKNGEMTIPKKADTGTVISINGVNLTLDNSLKKYANDPFFVEQTEKANRKFAQKKS